jgi:hypothetical protein
MTRIEQGRAARRRGELARDRGSRRVSSAIDAQRRLTARPARNTRTTADPLGPRDPRYAYRERTTGAEVRLARDELLSTGHEGDYVSESCAYANVMVDVFLAGKSRAVVSNRELLRRQRIAL